MEGLIFFSLALGPYKTNCYLVGDEAGNAVAVDPGDDGERILALAREKGLEIRAVLLTHCHWDHIGAVVEVCRETGSTAMLHRADLPMLEEWSPSPVERLRFLDHGEDFTVGALDFSVLHTPGHTPGGLCYRLGDLVFTGDTLFAGSVGRWDFPGGSREDLHRSLREQILILPDETVVYPGHGDSTTIGAERTGNPFLKAE